MQHEVLAHGQLAVQRERLRHVAYAPARVDVLRVDRMAKQPRLALAGGQQAGEHLHGGRLTAAVGAEKAEDLSATDAEIDVVDCHKVAKAHGQPARLHGHIVVCAGHQWRHHHSLVPLPACGRQQRNERGFQ